ncbi:MAG: MFS transporter [Pseudomonadota bacterium]
MTPTATPGARPRLAAWMLYNFGDTAFVVVVITFVWGLYFKRVVVGGPSGDLLWGLCGAASTLLVAAAAPLLGAAADLGNLKHRFLVIFSLGAIVLGASPATVGPGMVVWGMVLFVAANSAFQTAGVFYHAYLPELAATPYLSRVSGYGWAVGYAGAIVTVLAVSPLISGGFAPSNLPLVRLAFPLQGLIFLIFALPAFMLLREPARTTSPGTAGLLSMGGKRLRATWQGMRQLSELTRFLAAFVLYNDGLNTVLYFSMIYAADTLGFTLAQIIPLYLLVQTTGIVGAVVFGWLGDRTGIQRALCLCLVLWLGVLGAAWLVTTKGAFYAVAAAAGMLIGSTQSLSRAMMATLTPEGRTAEFFSFYGVSGRVSAAAGPLLFGVVSYATGSQRTALLTIAVFFGAGLYILCGVNGERALAQRLAGAAGKGY